MKQEHKEELENMGMDLLRESQSLDGVEKGKTFSQGLEAIKMVKEIDEMEYAAENQAERVQSERERTEAQERSEKRKLDISWKKIALDASLVMVPVLVKAALHRSEVREIMEYEKTGYVKSRASNMVLNDAPKTNWGK